MTEGIIVFGAGIFGLFFGNINKELKFWFLDKLGQNCLLYEFFSDLLENNKNLVKMIISQKRAEKVKLSKFF